jgi:hypothetical protein
MTIPETEMPAPRLELRWVDIEPIDGDFRWTVECRYSLVLALGESDIRAERDDEAGNPLPNLKEKSVLIGTTRSTGTAAKRHNAVTDLIDAPFRDGAHAAWDRSQLGNLPVYAVANGRAAKQMEPKP